MIVTDEVSLSKLDGRGSQMIRCSVVLVTSPLGKSWRLEKVSRSGKQVSTLYDKKLMIRELNNTFRRSRRDRGGCTLL